MATLAPRVTSVPVHAVSYTLPQTRSSPLCFVSRQQCLDVDFPGFWKTVGVRSLCSCHVVVHIRHHDSNTGTSRGSTRTSCGVHPAGAHVSDCNCDDDRDSVDMNNSNSPRFHIDRRLSPRGERWLSGVQHCRKALTARQQPKYCTLCTDLAATIW